MAAVAPPPPPLSSTSSVGLAGKAGTFGLLYAFPFLLLASHEGTAADIARPIAWAFTIWGVALYWWAGVLYLMQFKRLLRRRPE